MVTNYNQETGLTVEREKEKSAIEEKRNLINIKLALDKTNPPDWIRMECLSMSLEKMELNKLDNNPPSSPFLGK